MKGFPIVAMLLAAQLAASSAAWASGALSLSWDRPAGPGQPPITMKSFSGPGPVEVYVTVEGQDVPLRALQLEIKFGTAACAIYPVPDAWRFDAEGCQANGICYVGGGLRDLLPGSPSPTALSDYTYDDLNRTARARVAELYAGIVDPDPSATYTLAKFRFDLSLASGDSPPPAGQCGGAAEPFVLYIRAASYIDAAGLEVPWAFASSSLGWNTTPYPLARASCFEVGSSPEQVLGVSPISTCDSPVPAHPSSWGQLKSVYR